MLALAKLIFFLGIFWGIKLHFWSPRCFFGASSWMTCCNMRDGDVCWGGEMGGRLLGHRTPYGDRIKLTTFNSSNSIVDEHMFPYNPYSYFYITYRTLNKLKVWAFWLPSPPKGCYRFDSLPSLFHPFSSIFYGLPTAAPTITY